MPDWVKLKEHTDNLSSLLENVEDGLYSWCMMVGNEWKVIADMWNGPEKKEDKL